jgi:hypothetical protein
VTEWALCASSTLFLASRFFYVRRREKGSLGLSEYFPIIALLSLFAGTGLLQSTRNELYAQLSAGAFGGTPTAAIELLWITIYCVKASFFNQFKFHKPLYAYVPHCLTCYYWITVAICGSAFPCTIIVPIVLCPNFSRLAELQVRIVGEADKNSKVPILRT